ncbi:MAG TPA: mechanosensitive ion channel family protein [Anaerolineales bacterium]|nr:mechanosensitive ion channel family protein [Anaerolineales bacterium]
MDRQLMLSAITPFVPLILRLALIVALTLCARWGLRLAARLMERRLGKTVPNPERLARLQTLVQVGRGAMWALILLMAGLMALHTLGVDATPLLAGAGVAGLALSLGAQTLIKDFIGGILILVENQFSVGDVIKVGEVTGGVERITLRATYLRDIEGRLHIVPNGDIRLVSNLTAEWARAVVDLNVGYEADVSKVLQTLEAAVARAQEDEAIKADLLEAPQALGWISFNDWAVQVRLMAKTKPGKQWGVMMALRQYAVEALQAAGIRVALPAQKVIHDSAPA